MKVDICHIPYEVNHVECVDPKVDGECLGMIIHSKCEILIKEGLPLELEIQTLIHEMIHGILVLIGRDDLSNDETFVQTLSLAIYQTFNIMKIEGDDNADCN